MLRVSILVKLLTIIVLNSGCASIDGPTEPHDPFESYNRTMTAFNESFDENVAQPVARTYQIIVPTPVDKSISNFFANINDVNVLINDILQLKFTQALQDFFRIFFNSTIGLFGIFDVATHLDLPRHREDFGQTLGFWGVPAGPYLVLPFLGPSTVRDSVGLATDYVAFDPVLNQVDNVRLRNSMLILEFVDTRADLLNLSSLINIAALDPYIFTREGYLQRRQNLVYDGNPPQEEFEDEPENPTAPANIEDKPDN